MPRAKPAEPQAEELPPCGRCDPRTRLDHAVVSPPGGTEIIEIIRRCPDCSPHPPGCGHHVTPPGQPCGLCIHDVGERADREYAGPPPVPPGPHEPGDLMSMPIPDIARELRDLREGGPLPARIFDRRTDREQLMLREIAARQCAASRRAGIRGLFREPEYQPGKHARR